MLPPSLSPRAGGVSYDPAEAIGNRPAIRQNRAMLSDAQRRFLDYCRIGHLATADRKGVPHVIPVCYVLAEGALYITIDEKPKRQDRPLKRVRNILENPQAAFVTDRYDEDWRRLGWVMLREGVSDGFRRLDVYDGLRDLGAGAGPGAGGARLRIAVGAGALSYPAQPQDAVPGWRRFAEAVLRRDGPVRDAERRGGGHK